MVDRMKLKSKIEAHQKGSIFNFFTGHGKGEMFTGDGSIENEGHGAGKGYTGSITFTSKPNYCDSTEDGWDED